MMPAARSLLVFSVAMQQAGAFMKVYDVYMFCLL